MAKGKRWVPPSKRGQPEPARTGPTETERAQVAARFFGDFQGEVEQCCATMDLERMLITRETAIGKIAETCDAMREANPNDPTLFRKGAAAFYIAAVVELTIAIYLGNMARQAAEESTEPPGETG